MKKFYLMFLGAMAAVSMTANAASTTVLNETFDWTLGATTSILGWDTSNESSYRYDKWSGANLENPGWYSYSGYVWARPGFIKLGKTKTGGDIESPALAAIEGTKNLTVTFQAVGYTSAALTNIDNQELYVGVTGAGKVTKVEVSGLSETGGAVQSIVNGVAYKQLDAEGNAQDITVDGVAYIKLDSANHFNKTLDPTGLEVWNKAYSKYTLTVEGATSATRIFFIGKAMGSMDVTNRIFIDNVTAVASDAPSALKGDINGDGVVNVTDATSLVNKVLGTADYADSICDMNADGVINVTDVTALVNIILGNSK